MKQIFLIMLLACTSCKIIHPNTPIGGYKQLPELNKFEGEWMYSDSVQNFKLSLHKEKVKVNDRYLDFILGSYCYTKIGDTISCTFNLKDKTILSGSTIYDESKKTLSFLVIDKLKNKRGNGFLKLLPNNINKGEWILNNEEGIRIGDFDTSFSIPTRLILKKVK